MIRISLLLIIYLFASCSESIYPPPCNPASTGNIFATDSIWNKTIPLNAVYADVSNAIFGNPETSPVRLYLDLVTLICTDPEAPTVKIQQSFGWGYPWRSLSLGPVFYERNIPSDAGVWESQVKDGNGIFAIIDLATGDMDEGTALWRNYNSDLLYTFFDEPRLHYNIYTGDGLSGTRGSGLSGIGGVVLKHELNTGIDHAMVLTMTSKNFHNSPGYVWPAWTKDAVADDLLFGYQGSDPNYTIGTLLAIPYSTSLASLGLTTSQGMIVAAAAQNYGIYVGDTSSPSSNTFGLGTSFHAALTDFGVSIDTFSGSVSYDPSNFDMSDFEADFIKILEASMAVTSNVP